MIKRLTPPLALLLTVAVSGCHRMDHTVAGTFERTLSATGPVILDITNGSGDIKITAGSPGQVRIHADLRLDGFTFGGRARMAEIISHPAIGQQGNFIHIGGQNAHNSGLAIDYVISAPPDTEVRGVTGAGAISATGLRGPLNITSGRGDLAAAAIQNDVEATTGRGDMSFASVRGNIHGTTGHGDVSIALPLGEVRVRTGRGDITLASPGAAVSAETGRGDVTVAGARYDLRLHSGAGDITCQGDPLNRSYWDFQTGSGSVDLKVPPTASFRLHARSRSGSVEISIPMVIEEKTSNHELRARAGQGQARVDVDTASGNISVH